MVTKRSFVAALLGLLLPVLGSTAAQPPAVPKILVLGDSVSAGYGLANGEGWVTLLQNRLRAQGYGYRVVNASVTGETTAGGITRLPRALGLHAPQIVIIELGGNDGLRGLPLETSRANLQKMIDASKAAGAKVLLLGMKIPPNYGPRYADEFERMYSELAKKNRIAFEPFFLEKIALVEGMMQEDGIHPTAKAQAPMLDALWPVLKPLLKR